ncbi:hypothetical protein SEA_BACHOME_85 [Mycobacterium phage Bachome]|nr:hypothetical protein SEA_BACHOME_85 [Mycobacterium phage Bachome]
MRQFNDPTCRYCKRYGRACGREHTPKIKEGKA